MTQPASQRGEQKPIEAVERKEAAETPPDWLAPKVYKSSTLI